MDLTWLALTVEVLAMLFVAYLAWSIFKEPCGQRRIEKVADYIEEGAKASEKRKRRSIQIELLIEESCPRGFIAP
jgi:Na+/H+-translocating membrane pyrophosphatase